MSVDTNRKGPSAGVDDHHLRLQEPNPEGGEGGLEDDATEESEDEDKDEEPILKYEKIGGALPDLLQKDSASALTVSNGFMALGTHGGVVHILDLSGKQIKSFKPHKASVTDIDLDSTTDFVATSSIDGRIVIHSLSTAESYAFDMKRPMRTVSMEPHFYKKSSRAFVCGGLEGNLQLFEKGWLGHKETVLHQGEGPVWHARWNGRLIAWANDVGVKIYDMVSQSRIAYIQRLPNSPRADLFKYTLHWQDHSTLLIASADSVNIVCIENRFKIENIKASSGSPSFVVEVVAVFQVDCKISGVSSYPVSPVRSHLPSRNSIPQNHDSSQPSAPDLTSLLVLAYIPPPTDLTQELTSDRSQQRRLAAEMPELRIITKNGEEVTADVLPLNGFERWSCGDYVLCDIGGGDGTAEKSYVVMSPKDIILVRPRDAKDHIMWLVSRKRYEEALMAVEQLAETGIVVAQDDMAVGNKAIGQRYIEYLVGEGDFLKAAQLCPKVCAQDSQCWEHWIFVFSEKRQLQAIIPYVPTDSPRLGHLVYEMILAYFIKHDHYSLLKTIQEWPKEIYDTPAVIFAVQSELDEMSSSSTVLMESLADLYVANRQPGKALPYFLHLRRPNVFDLIRENNLFVDVKDQALQLVEFDQEIIEKQQHLPTLDTPDSSTRGVATSNAIDLLVDNTHSIPIGRVVQQLHDHPYYLFLYLDALFNKDPYLVNDFADLQVELYAKHAGSHLINFLRASTYYNLEAAYKICNERNLILEMVFLLGHMGNNKKALNLIIERLGDVNQAIDFAKEQSDNDLWEDLLKYSETRPSFIRGLLENVGVEIDPILLIRCIKNGLKIPGLKDALIKILQDFHLQISLLEGCQAILHGDSGQLGKRLCLNQMGGFFITTKTECPLCCNLLIETPQSLLLFFLCRHILHARCLCSGGQVSHQFQSPFPKLGVTLGKQHISGKIAYALAIKAKVKQGCPVCHQKGDHSNSV